MGKICTPLTLDIIVSRFSKDSSFGKISLMYFIGSKFSSSNGSFWTSDCASIGVALVWFKTKLLNQIQTGALGLIFFEFPLKKIYRVILPRNFNWN
jgi:hypothetical protein